MAEFQRTLSADISDAQAAMQLELKPGGRISDDVAQKVEKTIKENSLGATQLFERAPQFFADARAAASERLVFRLKEMEQKASALMQALASKAGAQVASELMIDGRIKAFAETGNLPLAEIRLKPPESNLFVKLRTGALGASGGMMLAFYAGGIVGSVVPVVGTIIGSHIGLAIAAIWGMTKATEYQGTQEIRAAQQQLVSGIDRELGNMLVIANAEFSKASQSISAHASEALRQIVDQNEQRLAQQRKAIQERTKADKDTLQREKMVIEGLMKDMNEIERQLSSFEAAVRG